MKSSASHIVLLAALVLGATQASASVVTVVSNTGDWLQSTTVASSTAVPWSGVPGGAAGLPAASTYTVTPSAGAGHVANVAGSTNLFSGSGVRYYRSVFTLGSFGDLSADIQLSVDNDIQVFINGAVLALEGSLSVTNFTGVHHRLFVDTDESVTNGYLGGNSFDTVPTTFSASNWLIGSNEIVLAVRNPDGGDTGGFSFRMDVTTSPGTAVPEPATWLLLAGGLAGIAARRSRGRR